MSAPAATAIAVLVVVLVLPPAIAMLLCNAKGAPRKEALKSQVGRFAAAARRIFLWGR